MDVYSSEHTVSPMTDTGDPSDGEKETDIDPLYTNSRMELKVQKSEGEDSSAQNQRQGGELSVESNVSSIGQRTPMSSGDVNDNSNNLPIHNYSSHSHSHSLPLSVQENGHPHGHEMLSSKNSSVYDFNDSTSVSEESHNEMPLVNVSMNENNSLSVSNKDCDQIQENNREKSRSLSHSVSEYSGHNHSQSGSLSSHHLSQSQHQNFSQSHDVSHSQSHSVTQSLQGINQQPAHSQNQAHLQNQRLNNAQVSNQGGEQSMASLDMSGESFNANDSYDDSLSVVSEYSNPGTYDGIIRRTRGRPRGSKNGTGMGRARGRGYKFARLSDERSNASSSSYDLRNVSDPYSCQRRGRPRSRFIVDLGEQNHEAWTKSKEELKISDAELTTLLLSLLESRKDNKESEDAETMLSLASSEYKKWSEKFASQLSLLTHYASIHNTTCCTCLGIKKKKYIPAGTGKRGRPRKYPPPVGCDDDREKSVYGAANNVVKNMLNVSLGGSLGSSVNLTMKHEGGSESMDDVQVPSLREAVHMSEHMRHMAEHRDTPGHLKDPMDQDDTLRMSDHHSMQVNDDHLHMPQDLTRMTASQAHMNDNDRMSAAPQAHMNDLRSSATDSPGRMSDTPAHMTDNLGRMSVENFGRMTGTPGGYLAEHLRRMAENQSRMSDSMSHYDDRDNYSRLGDNLRTMSRGSSGDPMGRLGENLSHMGVIRPSQTPSSTSQWPPHMQNHSALEGMNQSAQSSQHTLYPLPFWPYDPSLRQYHH